MEIKFVIFVFISVFLAAAIYSSSSFVQFAFSAYKDYCAFGPGGTWVCIVITDTKAGIYIVNCKEKCSVDGLARGSPLPSELRDS